MLSDEDIVDVLREFFNKNETIFDETFFDYKVGCNVSKDISAKVIFLDIDGVLTDDVSIKLKINEDRLRRLKIIIDETDAKVVLSSSRRRAYRRYVQNPDILDDTTREDMDHLVNMFNKYDIKILDWTCDVGFVGYRARPYEVKAWLLDKPYLESFVILDDDPWDWKWLNSHVVRTIRKDPNDKYEKLYGLEAEHAVSAIKILNQLC